MSHNCKKKRRVLVGQNINLSKLFYKLDVLGCNTGMVKELQNQGVSEHILFLI